MYGSILRSAIKIKDICKTLKVLPDNDSTFSSYRRKLFADLQRLVLNIGLEEREDEFEESKHPRDENGRFASSGSSVSSKTVEAAGDRKGYMKPETPVTFRNPKEIGRGDDGRPITHFNHDEEEMDVVRSIQLRDEYMDKYELCIGKITHLTVFAGKGTDKELGVAKNIAEKFGGKPDDWKHVKGIGKVKGRDGEVIDADIHWFENENIGQAGWKIKQFRSDMGESQIYWKEK